MLIKKELNAARQLKLKHETIIKSNSLTLRKLKLRNEFATRQLNAT